ncbi:MAG: hypothetical protein ACPGEG_05960 [Salibacteraceae bacterium]
MYGQSDSLSLEKIRNLNRIHIDIDFFGLHNSNFQMGLLPTLNYSRKFLTQSNGLYAIGGVGASTNNVKKFWSFKGNLGIGFEKKWFIAELTYQGYFDCTFGMSKENIEEAEKCLNKPNDPNCAFGAPISLPIQYNQWGQLSIGTHIGKHFILLTHFGYGRYYHFSYHLNQINGTHCGFTVGYEL